MLLSADKCRLCTADEVPCAASSQQVSSKLEGNRQGNVMGSNQQLQHLPKGEASSSSTRKLGC